jgi:DNA-binding XRE family transcriptional regulator
MGSGERMASNDRSPSGQRQQRSVVSTVAVGASAETTGTTSAGALASTGARARPTSPLGTLRLFSDRASLERRLRAELERHGFAVEVARPDSFAESIEPRTLAIIDAVSDDYDADELLAHVGLARALGAVPVVVLPTDSGQLAEIEELVEELCGGLVTRGEGDMSRLAATIARRASALHAARFEYLTVSPRASAAQRSATSAGNVSAPDTASSAGRWRGASSAATTSPGATSPGATSPGSSAAGSRGAPLLAIFADGSCALVERPVALEDDFSDVTAITIAEDAVSARIDLESGRVLSLTAGEAFTRSVRSPSVESRSLSAAEILAQIDGPTLGARIRMLRLGAGLTQAELARRTGIHRPNIARVEAGRHTPSLETIARLAAAIGVPATRVLEG